MPSKARQIVESLSQTLLGSQFDLERQSEFVVRDAGIDARHITPKDLRDAFNDTLTDRWPRVAFTADEV